MTERFSIQEVISEASRKLSESDKPNEFQGLVVNFHNMSPKPTDPKIVEAIEEKVRQVRKGYR